jgi:hypothetical protein
MVMIPRKIESGMDTTDDRRMTENGPMMATRSMNERRNT